MEINPCTINSGGRMRKKITWNSVGIEITRKCNIQCEHCLRGEAQNIDLSHGAIDNFLENTESIGHITFLGGEPSLNTEGMYYLLTQLSKREIPLCQMAVITNGVNQSAEFVRVIKAYYKFISYCQSYINPGMPASEFIQVEVSTDKFHPVESKTGFEYYKRLLSPKFAKVVQNKTGEIPISCGRAKKIYESIDLTDYNLLARTSCKVAIQEKSDAMDFKCKNNFNLEHDEQIYVPCFVFISSKGWLYNAPYAKEYDQIDGCDKKICCLNNDIDIYSELKEYNKDLECYVCDLIKKSTFKNDIKIWERKYASLNNISTKEAHSKFADSHIRIQ